MSPTVPRPATGRSVARSVRRAARQAR